MFTWVRSYCQYENIWSDFPLRNHIGALLHSQPTPLKSPLHFPCPKTGSYCQRSKLLTRLEPCMRISGPFPSCILLPVSAPRASLAACPDPWILKFGPILFLMPGWSQGHPPFLDLRYKLSSLPSACPPGHCLAWCPVYVKNKKQDREYVCFLWTAEESQWSREIDRYVFIKLNEPRTQLQYKYNSTKLLKCLPKTGTMQRSGIHKLIRH